MDNRPIGVFDSGLGGLSAVKPLHRMLPHENIIYFGDTGRAPYGSRGAETIRQYAEQDARFLLSHDVKCVLAACGTVSTVATQLPNILPVPYANVLLPTAVAAVNATQNGKIGVLGTAATVNSNAFAREIHRMNDKLQVVSQACPLFVPLVENGCIDPDDPVVIEIARRYLVPLMEQGVDTVILGCTHYPLLKRVIGPLVGDDVILIDSGKEGARRCAEMLEAANLLSDRQEEGEEHFFVSDHAENFSEVARLFLKTEELHASLVQIEDF